jgi:hypothetical protein
MVQEGGALIFVVMNDNMPHDENKAAIVAEKRPGRISSGFRKGRRSSWPAL